MTVNIFAQPLRGFSVRRIPVFLFLVISLTLQACGSARHVSKYDPNMDRGIADFRTSLNTYLPDDSSGGHSYSPKFFSGAHAQNGTLIVQARATPGIDSAVTKNLLNADSALMTLERKEQAHKPYPVLLIFRDEVNADLNTAIESEKVKLNKTSQ